mgnify:CR=1 FL=1
MQERDRSSGDDPVHQPLIGADAGKFARGCRLALPLIAASLVAATLAGCGAVNVKPESQLPKALVQPLNARVGLVLDEALRNYTHEETRASSDWKVELGPPHEKMLRQVFGASFTDLVVFNSLDEARAASGLQGLIEPHIEQYSFATANETSGAYWAVTIRYRIGVYTPQGEATDSLVLTGYGSVAGSGKSGPALGNATRAAMRDAAAKILVQLPRQPLAQKMAAGEVLLPGNPTAMADPIETVPIESGTETPAG